jgi:hypothetical protein
LNHALLPTCVLALLCGCATMSDPPAVNVRERSAALQAANRLAQETEKLLSDAESEIKASEIERAKNAIAQARQNLTQPEMAFSDKRAALEQRAKQNENWIAQLPPAPAQRVAAPQPKVDPTEVLQNAEAALAQARAGLHGHELAQDDVRAARSAREALSGALEANKGLDVKDDAVAALVKAGVAAVEESDAEIKLAALIADFVAGPGAAHKKAYELIEQAKREANAAKRNDAQREARGALEECVRDSRKMIVDNDVLNRTALFLAEERTSPKKVSAACAAQMRALDRRLGKNIASR